MTYIRQDCNWQNIDWRGRKSIFRMQRIAVSENVILMQITVQIIRYIHAISAVFALDGKAYKRHGTALAAFNKDYISKGVFDKSFGRRIVNASEIRHASDYDDFYIASKDEVVKQIELAKDLISEVERYIDSKK